MVLPLSILLLPVVYLYFTPLLYILLISLFDAFSCILIDIIDLYVDGFFIARRSLFMLNRLVFGCILGIFHR